MSLLVNVFSLAAVTCSMGDSFSIGSSSEGGFKSRNTSGEVVAPLLLASPEALLLPFGVMIVVPLPLVESWVTGGSLKVCLRPGDRTIVRGDAGNERAFALAAGYCIT